MSSDDPEIVEVNRKDTKGKQPARPATAGAENDSEIEEVSPKEIKGKKSGRQGQGMRRKGAPESAVAGPEVGPSGQTKKSGKGRKQNIHGANTSWLWEGGYKVKPEFWKELIEDQRLGRPQLAVCPSNFLRHLDTNPIHISLWLADVASCMPNHVSSPSMHTSAAPTAEMPRPVVLSPLKRVLTKSSSHTETF